MHKFKFISVCNGSLLIYLANYRFQTFSLIVLTSNGGHFSTLHNVVLKKTNMLFVSNLSRLVTVIGLSPSSTLIAFAELCLSFGKWNLHSYPVIIFHSHHGPILNRSKFSLHASTLSLRFWSVYSWGIQRDANFLFLRALWIISLIVKWLIDVTDCIILLLHEGLLQ